MTVLKLFDSEGGVMPGARGPFILKILLAAALLVLIAVVRMPFIGNVLAGEEGDFAALVLDDVPTSVASDTHLPRDQIGYIDGKPVLTSFHRTVMPYIILEQLGRALAVRHALGRLPAEQLTVAARLPFAIIFLLGIVGLIGLTVEAAASPSQRPTLAANLAPLGLTLWALTTPLAVGSSIEPQVDGSVGVLLLGTAASLLVVGDIERGAARWRFLGAGLLAGLGKHEWALAFGAAALGTLLAVLLFSSLRRGTALALAAFFIALAVGVALSYAASPADYRNGFGVMESFYSRTGGHLWALEPPQLPFTLPVVALVAADGIFLALVLRPVLRTAPGLLLAYLGASAITVGYIVSGWPGDFFPRYFTPPLIISTIVFAALWLRFKDRIAPAIGWTVVAGAVLGLGTNYLFLSRTYDSKVALTSFRGTPLADLKRNAAAAAALWRDRRDIVFTFTPTWIYNQGINYISAGLQKFEAEEHIETSYPAYKGHIVYPPERLLYPQPPQ
jgi:hypothetical protein